MKSSESILEKGGFWEVLVKVALPAVLVIIIMIIYNVADTFFIGKTNDPNKIAAISLSMPIFTILPGFGTLFGNGGTTQLSIALGQKDRKKIKQVTSFCFIGSMLVGIIFFVVMFAFTRPLAVALGADESVIDLTVTYIKTVSFAAPLVLFSTTFGSLVRADGDSMTAAIASIVGTIVNIVLDAFFILVLNLDVFGAALATVLGNVINTTIILVVLYRKKKELIPKLDFTSLKKEVSLPIIALGLPMTMSTVLGSLGTTIQNRLIMKYGAIELAAMGVSGKVGMVITMIIMGICMGMQPAFSYNFGAKNYDRMYDLLKKTGIFTAIMGLILTILVARFKDDVIRIFIDSDEVIAYGEVFVIAAVIVGPVYSIYQLSQVFMQSTGKADYAIFASVLDKGLIFIPVLLIMDKLFGVYGIAFSHAITMVFTLAITAYLALKWAKNIVEVKEV